MLRHFPDAIRNLGTIFLYNPYNFLSCFVKLIDTHTSLTLLICFLDRILSRIRVNGVFLHQRQTAIALFALYQLEKQFKRSLIPANSSFLTSGSSGQIATIAFSFTIPWIKVSPKKFPPKPPFLFINQMLGIKLGLTLFLHTSTDQLNCIGNEGMKMPNIIKNVPKYHSTVRPIYFIDLIIAKLFSKSGANFSIHQCSC